MTRRRHELSRNDGEPPRGDDAYLDQLERQVKGVETVDAIYRRRITAAQATGDARLVSDLTRALAVHERGADRVGS